MNATESGDLNFLQQLLVCPLCKSRLEFFPDSIRCVACDVRFRQSEDDYIDLLPRHLMGNTGDHWGERQREMEGWYKNLIADATQACECFACDYQPYAPLLATLSGDIVDVGGGNGIVRHFLPDSTRYIAIDPSLEWLGTDWQSLADRFPCLKTCPCFVRGIGEYLPFPACSFDVVLSFWSLNHVHQPGQVFREASRVLRPAGRFLVVLEDMEPRWLDIVAPAWGAKGISHRAGTFLTKFQCSLGRRVWPLQSDHIRIRESDVRAWSSQGFEIIRRAWIGQYLTYELRRT